MWEVAEKSDPGLGSSGAARAGGGRRGPFRGGIGAVRGMRQHLRKALGKGLSARGIMIPVDGSPDGRALFRLRRRDDRAKRPVVLASTTVATQNKGAVAGAGKAGGHAMAGAMAGSLVSVCLHPIDTIKVIVQAERSGNRSLPVIISNFVGKRGVGSLYSGLTTNLATSAPISAIYTTTYEAVKEALLPIVPEDKKWMAHCVAGGCSSVATSFVYTPSECIKQRLQVGMYKSPFAAGLGILKNEGLGTLYGGWTAVICRNVPQSVIKFLTYEQLKSVARRFNGGEEPSTAQTLLIGGISGSTAAFVTTPFDVIKTRLQTQVAGQGVQYKGVFETLKGITATEGFSGLYRGVTPRLFIYVTQGAIFFASYELMKRAIHMQLLKKDQVESKAVKAASMKASS